MTLDHGDWSEHQHEAIRHGHRHFHVTHNFIERVGAFEHLGFSHDHDHDHGPETHQHYPHQDMDSEHLGEAHGHDHGNRASTTVEATAPAKKTRAKKAAAGTSTPRKTPARGT